MRNLSEVNLIHKSNVYFEVVEPLVTDSKVTLKSKDLMHYGEIYIYSNYLFLYDGERWYKADIQDITSIKSISNEKQILIQFKDFDLIIVPGRGHGVGEIPYTSRRRMDFFVRHLLGVEPRSQP